MLPRRAKNAHVTSCAAGLARTRFLNTYLTHPSVCCDASNSSVTLLKISPSPAQTHNDTEQMGHHCLHYLHCLPMSTPRCTVPHAQQYGPHPDFTKLSLAIYGDIGSDLPSSLPFPSYHVSGRPLSLSAPGYVLSLIPLLLL